MKLVITLQMLIKNFLQQNSVCGFLFHKKFYFSAQFFVAYAVFRGLHPEMFIDAHHHLSWKMGALNTVILIISSFTMVMSVHSAQVSNKKATFWYLLMTFVLASAFMVVKGLSTLKKFLMVIYRLFGFLEKVFMRLCIYFLVFILLRQVSMDFMY